VDGGATVNNLLMQIQVKENPLQQFCER
jgi:hypothetical protein